MSDQDANQSPVVSDVQSTTPLTDVAERLCLAFRAVAERELPTMAASARLVLRAWAEAELAVLAARRSGDSSGQALPSAEAFRTRCHLPREEVSRERITRWCGHGREPLDDETDQQAVRHNGAWVVMHPGSSRPRMQLGQRAEFERVTYLEPQSHLYAEPLAASLAVPALVAGDIIGWEPVEHVSPADILVRLDKLEAASPAERQTAVEHVLVRHVSSTQPAPTP